MLKKFLLFVYNFYSKSQTLFQSMEVKNSNFTAFIDVLTPNTYIMVIMSDPTIRKYQLQYIINFIILYFII